MERINIWEEGEYNYPAAYGFQPNLRTYLHEDDTVRECMLVIPGGGYCMVVNHEGEIIAKEFYNQGMNAFVLTYTTDITMSVPLQKQPLQDLSRAIRLIRKNSEKFHIDPSKICIAGFSAGGHLCATAATHFDDASDTNETYRNISARPDAAILSYPVITAGKYTHRESIASLVGWNAAEEERDYFSLEKQVTENTPPCFLWSTYEDGLVPCENVLLFSEALREKKIPFAQYIFPYGNHGLSLATEQFFQGKAGGEYTYEQLNLAIEAVKNGTAINVSEQRHDELMMQFFGTLHPEEKKEEEKKEQAEPAPLENPNPYPDVRMWPTLARNWLDKVFA